MRRGLTPYTNKRRWKAGDSLSAKKASIRNRKGPSKPEVLINVQTIHDSEEQKPSVQGLKLPVEEQKIPAEEDILPVWFKEIPDEKVTAFKEAIDLLECSTDEDDTQAEHLLEKLVKVDSSVTLEETMNVLKRLARDTHGKVDFEQFMGFLCPRRKVSLTAGEKKKYVFTERQRLFYSAFYLTLKKLYAGNEAKSFSKMKVKSKQRLPRKSGSMLDYKMSYTRRVERELKRVQGEYKKKNMSVSPYAQSILLAPPPQIHKGAPLVAKTSFQPPLSNLKKLQRSREERPPPRPIKFAKAKPRSLWNEHNLYSNRITLPVLKGLIAKHKQNYEPSYEDLPKIRKQIDKDFGKYYENLQKITAENAEIHWNLVYSEAVKPHKVMKDFKDVFWSYSKRKHDNVFPHCQLLPTQLDSYINIKF